MATLQDIADVVGVSSVTVSKVLRGKIKGSWPRSAAQAERIREVADQLGYRVDWRARALKNKRTNMIGLLSTDKVETRSYDFRLLEGLNETFADKDYNLVFVRARQDSNGHDFADSRFDGLVIDYHIEPEEIRIIQRAKLPAVIINAPSHDGITSVMPDHRVAGRLAAQHLLDLGHRRIALVQQATNQQSVWPQHMYQLWREGILDAMKDAGLDTGQEYTDIIPDFIDPAKDKHAYAASLAAFLEKPNRPTGVIVHNPEYTVEFVLQNLESLGLRCPDDLSVIAMSDEMQLGWTTPGVTAVRLPYRELGIRAAQVLVNKIEANRDDDASDQTENVDDVEIKLIVRDSTSPPPKVPGG
ncbi:MAG: LacI family DNA-binding transcriptional regulator [Planctomycetota bacterium]